MKRGCNRQTDKIITRKLKRTGIALTAVTRSNHLLGILGRCERRGRVGRGKGEQRHAFKACLWARGGSEKVMAIPGIIVFYETKMYEELVET